MYTPRLDLYSRPHMIVIAATYCTMQSNTLHAMTNTKNNIV
jgi:hypothetical protein